MDDHGKLDWKENLVSTATFTFYRRDLRSAESNENYALISSHKLLFVWLVGLEDGFVRQFDVKTLTVQYQQELCLIKSVE